MTDEQQPYLWRGVTVRVAAIASRYGVAVILRQATDDPAGAQTVQLGSDGRTWRTFHAPADAETWLDGLAAGLEHERTE